MQNQNPLPAPLRFYLIYDKDSEIAKDFADYFYEWFRTQELTGPPVYVRTSPESLESLINVPRIPSSSTLEYFIPLIDAEITGDPKWHDALSALAKRVGGVRAPQRTQEPDLSSAAEFFPVALHASAINCPPEIANRNSIRYKGPEWAGKRDPKIAAEFDEIIKHLSESFVRDLSFRLLPSINSPETQIFISYARADTPEIPKSLRNYIQSSTQCDAFLDENDIAFGSLFEEVLRSSTSNCTALIAVWSDHYPYRPWCRFEVENFTYPKRSPEQAVAKTPWLNKVRYIPPMLVLDTQSGKIPSRVLPEFARTTCVRYNKGGELEIFKTLMREVFHGLVGYREALLYAEKSGTKSSLFLNKLPRVETLHSLLEDQGDLSIRFPGRGPSKAEAKLLANHRLLDSKQIAPFSEEREFATVEPEPEIDRCIWLSAGDTSKFPELGYHREHQRELFIKLLRPLVRTGRSLMYAGAPPGKDFFDPTGHEGEKRIHWTKVFFEIIAREADDRNANAIQDRAVVQTNPSVAPVPPQRSRLYNVPSWPATAKVDATIRAELIPAATIVDDLALLGDYRKCLNQTGPVNGFAFGEAPPYRTLAKLSDQKVGNWIHWREHYALAALALQKSRQRMAEGFECAVPGFSGLNGKIMRVQPACLVMIGGKEREFTGLAPGIFEEFLFAARKKIPIFILGGFGGASELLAVLLRSRADPKLLDRYPKLLDRAHYRTSETRARNPHPGKSRYELTEDGLHGTDSYGDSLKDLEEMLGSSSGLKALLNNELNDRENEALLTEVDINTAVELVWMGMERLGILKPKTPAPADSPPAT